MTDLGGFGGICTTVSDMNSRGQVVGTSLTTGDQAQRAFLWERGRLIDLGTSGGQSAAAGAINEKGDVAGLETIPPDDSVFHATLWSKGEIIDLGALAAGGCSVASSVNSRLQVVGINSSDCDFGDESSLRAVISENGGPMIDLNTLIPASSGVELRNASIINERGEIVAVGAFADGTRSPVLLVPCESGQAESCRQDASKVTRKPGLRQLTTPRAASQRDMKRMEIEMKRVFGPMGQPGGASKHGGPLLRER